MIFLSKGNGHPDSVHIDKDKLIFARDKLPFNFVKVAPLK